MSWKNAIKQSRGLLTAYLAVRGVLDSRRFAQGDIDSEGGSLTLSRPLEESLAYVNLVFEDYCLYGALTPEGLVGKRILELGPGDNLGVGLRFLARGAAGYVTLDKFYAPREAAREAALYARLRDQLKGEERERFEAALGQPEGGEYAPARIRQVRGVGAEEAVRVLPAGSFDLILSRAVLQETDAAAVWGALDELLAPGGMMMHQIDLRDHGMYCTNGFHPLEFLTVSEGWYDWIRRGAGRPNRRHIPFYERLARERGYGFDLYRCGLVRRDYMLGGMTRPYVRHYEQGRDYGAEQVAMVEEIRSRLRPEYRELPVADLLTAGIFVVARKPG